MLAIDLSDDFSMDLSSIETDTPESLLNADELRKIIMDSLNELGEETKTALTLREFDGLSYEQISEIINCPVGTVRSRIFRGRELLDEAIRKYKEDNKPLLSKIKQ